MLQAMTLAEKESAIAELKAASAELESRVDAKTPGLLPEIDALQRRLLEVALAPTVELIANHERLEALLADESGRANNFTIIHNAGTLPPYGLHGPLTLSKTQIVRGVLKASQSDHRRLQAMLNTRRYWVRRDTNNDGVPHRFLLEIYFVDADEHAEVTERVI